MKRFENAVVGDMVYHRKLGDGSILDVFSDSVRVSYDHTGGDAVRMKLHHLDGKDDSKDVEPMLFYRDGNNRYLTERPMEKLKASMVPNDTKVFTRDDHNDKWYKRHFHNNGVSVEIITWDDGGTSFTCTPNNTTVWVYAKLAEPLTINNVIYPKNTPILKG